MKKVSVLMVIVLALGFIAAPAAAPAASAPAAQGLPYVVDSAGLLSSQQQAELEQRAARMTEAYRCEVRIVTVPSIGELLPMHASNALYIEYEFGYGPGRSVVLLLLSIEGRDLDLAVWGFGHTAFTEYGKDVILRSHILPPLRSDNFYEAFSAYLDQTERYLALAREGTPFDRRMDQEGDLIDIGARLGIILVLPMLIASHICIKWEKPMKTAVIASAACDYIVPGGFSLSLSQDDFLYRDVRRVKIERSSSGGSGGTSTRSGSGGSHRSTKF